MTDTDKLKRLAEAWKKWGEHPYANAILALIAENERLRECATGPAAWLARWARHVGSCRADDGMRECTCGLERARYDLAHIDGDA